MVISKATVKGICRRLGIELKRYDPSNEPPTVIGRARQRLFRAVGFEVGRYHAVYKPRVVGRPVRKHSPVSVVRFGWATGNELFEFLDRQLYTGWEFDAANYGAPLDLLVAHQWSLKGYGYCLVVDAATRLAEGRARPLRILDVGGGGSGLTRFLADRFGAECWVVDDFGIESEDEHTAGWYRRGLRDTLVEQNPTVRYVFGRLGGDRPSELKRDYFDLICSVSTLEHISLRDMPGVFDHMLELLDDTAGVMVHAIDLPQGQVRDWQYFLGRYFRLRGVDPKTFVTHELNEGPADDPPLQESVEVLYRMYPRRAGVRRRMTTRFRRMGTLVLHVRCGERG